MTDRIFGLAIAALALLVWYLFHRADTEVETSVNRALGPVVPLDDLPHEQDSAEAYDDLPEGDDTLAMLHGMSEGDWREHLRLSDEVDRAQDALNAHMAHVEAKSIESTWADLHDLPVSEWPGGAA